MKRKVLAVIALLLTLSSTRLAHADSIAQNIADARTHYAQIERNLKNDTRVETDFPDQSSEGGTFIVYFHNGTPRKIVAHFFGEMGNVQDDYYFWNGRLFFVLETQIRYEEPLGKEKSRKQNRFYFTDAKLTRWVNYKGETQDETEKWFKMNDTEKLNDARQYLAKANQLLD